MNFLNGISIINGAFATDGGSISLLVADSQGLKHTILLSQHLLPFSGYPGEKVPGRLYLDGKIIDIRSETEGMILTALREASLKIQKLEPAPDASVDHLNPNMTVGDDIVAFNSKISEGPESALKHLLKELLEYVESDQYVSSAENGMDQAEHRNDCRDEYQLK